MEKYLVVWMDNERDYYKSFVDSDNNLENATSFYNELLLDETTYSANICLVVKSTDYI